MSGDAERIFFVHVMKTAGTSFLFVLRRNLGPKRIFPGPRARVGAGLYLDRLWALPPERHARLRAYSGHYPAFAADVVGASRKVTILRDPVERTISLLKTRQRPDDPPENELFPRTPHLSLEEIYAAPETAPWVGNMQTRVFALEPGDEPRSVLHPLRLDRARLDAAKERLAGFDIVGIHEDFGGFVAAADQAFGWPPGPEPRAFVSDDVPVPDRLRERIAEDTAWDRELYEFAVRLVAERSAARGAG